MRWRKIGNLALGTDNDRQGQPANPRHVFPAFKLNSHRHSVLIPLLSLITRTPIYYSPVSLSLPLGYISQSCVYSPFLRFENGRASSSIQTGGPRADPRSQVYRLISVILLISQHLAHCYRHVYVQSHRIHLTLVSLLLVCTSSTGDMIYKSASMSSRGSFSLLLVSPSPF